MRLTQPDPVTLERVRRAALVEMNRRGLATLGELAQLARAHVDDVLDRVFQHCAVLRVRVADGRYIEIHSGGKIQ